MVLEPVDARAWSLWMPPIGTQAKFPPRPHVPQIHAKRRLSKYERSWMQHLGQRARIVRGVRRDLRERDVSRRGHEALECVVRHRMPVDPEAVNLHRMRRRLFGIVD